MSANRGLDWAGLIAVWLTFCVIAVTTSAQEPRNGFAGEPNSIKSNIEILNSQMSEQNRRLEDMNTQISEQNRKLEDMHKNQEELNKEFLQRASHIAPLISAIIAAVAVVVASIAYRRNKLNAANTHMHGVFKDYLKMRFDHHQKLLEKGETYQRDTAAKPLNNSEETLAVQLAGIQLYALEEIFFWLKKRENKILFRFSRSEQDIYKSWQSTIASHLTQYPTDIAASVVIFAECYSVEFLEYVASVLRISEINLLVNRHKEAKECGKPRPPGFAIASYKPPPYTPPQVPSGAVCTQAQAQA